MSDALIARLLELRNADAGWGATVDRPSNVEATALATIALRGAAAEARSGGLAWLTSRQRSDGSWAWSDEVDRPSWATSLAMLALADAGGSPDAVRGGAGWLMRQESPPVSWRLRIREFLTRHQTVEVNYALEGWAWAPSTFSWVEPTAWAVLAMRRAIPAPRPRRIRGRLDEAQAMIVDRVCPGGGWNYGNGRVLDQDLEPYPDTTALALLGLQGSKSDTVESGFAVLDSLTAEAGSGLALALSALCRQAWGRTAADTLLQLERRFTEWAFLDETRLIALAAIAATENPAFRVQDP